MDYKFIRKLIETEDTELQQRIYDTLWGDGLEVFVEAAEPGAFCNMHAGETAPHGALYTSAADRERAAELLQGLGLAGQITPKECCIPDTVLSELEIAEEKYQKKRKWLYIECAVIIVIAIILLWTK